MCSLLLNPLYYFYFGLFVRTLCPWRGHQLRAVVAAELSSPCCILLPGGVEWTGAEREGETKKGQ